MMDDWGAATFLMDDRDYFMKDLEQTNRFAERPAEDLARGHIKPEDMKTSRDHMALLPGHLALGGSACPGARQRDRAPSQLEGS